MDDKSKSRTCKRGNSRLLNIAFKTKSIKERAKGHFLISQMHTSTREILLNMSSFTNVATNAFTTTASCHDLAKWLSHYLYFFSFLFLFLWTYNYKVEHGKVSRDFVTMSQWCDRWSCHKSQSQGVT